LNWSVVHSKFMSKFFLYSKKKKDLQKLQILIAKKIPSQTATHTFFF